MLYFVLQNKEMDIPNEISQMSRITFVIMKEEQLSLHLHIVYTSLYTKYFFSSSTKKYFWSSTPWFKRN